MKRISFQKSRKRRRPRRKPINVLASALTTAGLYCGIASIFAAIDGNFKWAAYYILIAQVFDMLDGTVAKLTHTTSEFGKQLDSLCDLVSFGTAPAVLIYTAYLLESPNIGKMGERTGSVMAIIFVICGALRLARFNVYQSESRDYFVGLPIPAAAATVATFVLFTHHFELQVAHWVLTPLTLGLAYLMVSTLRYPKDRMKRMVLAPRNAFRLLVLCGFGLAVFHHASQHSPAIALFPLAAAYVIYGVADAIYFRLIRRAPAPEAPLDTPAAETAPVPDQSSPNSGERL